MSKSHRDSTRKRLRYCIGRKVIFRGTCMRLIKDDFDNVIRAVFGRVYLFDMKGNFICKVSHINILYSDIKHMTIRKSGKKATLNYFTEDLPYGLIGTVCAYKKDLKEGMINAEQIDFGVSEFESVQPLPEYPEDVFREKMNKGQITMSKLSQVKSKCEGYSIAEIAAEELFNRIKNH